MKRSLHEIMRIWIALFRGINVGGKNILPMKGLVALLEGLGCTDVRTYIQSGNAVFSSRESGRLELEERIADAVSAAHGFRPRIILLSSEQLQQAVKANPFPEAEPRSLHLFFLGRKPASPDLEGLNAVKADSESFVLTGEVLYLHAPDGIGRSRLVQRAERLIGVDATARNWRTVMKIQEMASQL